MASFSSPIDQHVSSPVHGVKVDAPLEAARAAMKANWVSSLAVTDEEGRLAGVISRTDLLREARRQAGTGTGASHLVLPDRPVSEVMTRDVVSLPPTTTLAEAARAMVSRRIHRVFIADDRGVHGVLTPLDLMHAIHDQRLNKPVSEFMSSPLFSIRAEEPIALATERLERAKVTGLVVLEGAWPVGVYTQREALAARDLDRSARVDGVMSPAILCLDEATPLYRAAEQARATRVRRVVAQRSGRAVGILTGLDFARAAT